MIGPDLAKHVLQVYGAEGAERVVIRKQLRRTQVLRFDGRRPACGVATEACSSVRFWGRKIGRPGHEVRLIPPAYVGPFVERQKNDAADARQPCGRRMRIVDLKS